MCIYIYIGDLFFTAYRISPAQYLLAITGHHKVREVVVVEINSARLPTLPEPSMTLETLIKSLRAYEGVDFSA